MTASPEEVQAGVAVVNAVAAKLTGPLRVWVLFNDSEGGNCVWVSHTEATARQKWAEEVTIDYMRRPGVLSVQARDELVQDILHGKLDSCLIGDMDSYTLEEHEVQP